MSPFLKGVLFGVAGVYVYHRFIGVPTGVKGSVPGGTIG
jgi:hypothetical protein